jgi:hypothetical protein
MFIIALLRLPWIRREFLLNQAIEIPLSKPLYPPMQFAVHDLRGAQFGVCVDKLEQRTAAQGGVWARSLRR